MKTTRTARRARRAAFALLWGAFSWGAWAILGSSPARAADPFPPSAADVAAASRLAPPSLADRWFYAPFGVGSDAEADKLCALIRRAGAVDLNGLLWACDLEFYSRWDDARKARLERVRRVADENGIEIIPLLWSVGYGSPLPYDRNLAEGLPVRALPLKVANGRADALDETVALSNPSFEDWEGNLPTDVLFADEPGRVSFRDDEVFRDGKSSLRFENYGENPHGHGRVSKSLKLAPNRFYRATAWFRPENVAAGSMKTLVLSPEGAELGVASPELRRADENGWIKVSATFQTPASGEALLYLGIWEGEGGRFWVDDLTVEPIGMVNPLRRPGTPIVVFDETRSIRYDEGKDWILPEFPLNPWDANAAAQTLTIPEGSRIAEGRTISVDYYYPPLVGAPQIGVCMSEPKLDEFFERSAREIAEVLSPKKWFLSMDEIRCAGSCEACRARNISLAEILGDCVTRQYETIQRAAPGADVYIWSDMLDPNHNARADYYVCEGDYAGSWNFIPKELIISCWYYEKRDLSLKFFSERGFRTQAAAYYDTDDLDGCADWLESCAKTPGSLGIIYTTWRDKYELLDDFGTLVGESPLPKEPEKTSPQTARSNGKDRE